MPLKIRADGKKDTGRPLKFKTVEELEKKIEDYFKKTKPKDITIVGLALYLDTTRKTLIDYDHRDEFSDAIKKAKSRVELEYEKDLRKSGRSGDIFALKNFGWTDKTEVDNTVRLPHPLLDNVLNNDSNTENNKTE